MTNAGSHDTSLNPRWKRILRIVLVITCSLRANEAVPQMAPESLTITLPDGAELRISVFPATGARRVIWLPSVFGRAEAEQAMLTRLSHAGIEVWLADILTDRFLPRVNSSLEILPPSDIEAVLAAAVTRDRKRVFLVGIGRGAVPILWGSVGWSTREQPRRLRGIVLFWPSLYVRTPAPGQEGRYLPVVSKAGAPLLVYQPELSVRYWYLDRLRSELETAKVPVLVESIGGIRDGFFSRQEPTEAEVRLSERFPSVFEDLLERLEKSAP